MITVSDKKLCSCCFAEITSEPCSECGFSSVRYVADPAVLPCGSKLQERYIVGRVIGKGGFGITYLAYDTKLERRVAIKEFYPYGLAVRNPGDPVVTVSDEAAAEVFKKGAGKFYNEARLIARFNGNPGIVGVYDFFYENATVYFTMEYLSGQTLRNYIAGHGVLSEGQAVFLAEKVSMALMTVHSANVLHRDISPDNIMLCADGNIKLIDFGAARQVVADGSHDLSVILKPGFAPLEQYQKKGKQGPWTDIYSLGATLYFALTADTPDDPMTRLENDGNISDNTEKSEKIAPKLREFIRKAVMLKAEDRYQSVFELRNDLSGLSVTAVPIIEKSEPNNTAFPFGVTAQPYTASVRQTAYRTAASEDMRTVPLTDPSVTVPLTDPSVTVPLTDAPVTVPLTSSDMSAPISNGKRSGGKKKLVYGAGAAAILLVGILSGVLLSKVSDTDIQTETETSTETTESESESETTPSETEETETFTETTAANNIIYDSKEDLYPGEAETDNDVTEESSVTTEKVTEPKVTEPPVTEPKATEPKVTEPPVTEPKVTEPKVTEPAAPAVPDVITIGGKSYKTNMTGTLDLSGKGLKNKDIAGLKYMTKLSEIILSENSLTDLSALSGLTQLEKLTYHNNSVSDLSFAKNLTKLKVIGAENNGITDLSPLSGMSGLEEIWLQNNNISDMSPLKKCTKVNSLSLWGNPIKDCSAASGMKNIRNLHLNGCGLKSLEPFRSCTMLEYVYVGDNEITDLTPLCGNSGLIELNAQNNKLNGNYNALKGLTVLNWLDISGNGFNDPDELYEVMCYDIYSDDDGLAYIN